MSLLRKFRRLSASAGMVGILIASLSGCGGGSSGFNPGPGPGGGGSRSACQANTPHADGRARWTVLIYMNAANNLQPDSITNIAQLASVGSDANVNIVVQWKQAQCNDCGSPSFLATRRYLVKQHSQAQINQILNGDTTPLEADRLADPTPPLFNQTTKQSDMGDWRVLQDFIRWGTTNYPADNLAVVIWDHGSGWFSTRAARNKLAPSHRAVSQDNETNNEIQTWEMPQALGGAQQTIDALILDCSLEQMAEVAYEVRNNARVMVGSEDSPPGAGYPYDAWLTALKNSGKNPCDLASSIITTFVQNYPTESNITQSVLDLGKMQTFATSLDAFGLSLRTHAVDQADAIQSARQRTQHYSSPYIDNKDLFHFADLIRTSTNASDLQQAAANLQTVLTGTDGVILQNAHGSFNQANSNGLAIWIPPPGNFGFYSGDFTRLALSNAAANWRQFLASQVK